MKTKIALLLLFFGSISSAFTQNRVERPYQVQVNFSGLFVDLAGNSLADNTVDELKINQWLPGISLGYHLNKNIYVGYSMIAPLDMTLIESWGLTGRGLDADIVLEHQPGAIHNLELRYSPFKFGLYLAANLSNIGAVDYQMTFDRKFDEIWIGNNQYATDLDINWNSKNITRLSFGLGYNIVLNSGLSFNVGLAIPTGFPDDENIDFITRNSSVTILESDLAFANQRIQDETFYGPISLYLNVGYNLKSLFRK
jgi:hypothetical protein